MMKRPSRKHIQSLVRRHPLDGDISLSTYVDSCRKGLGSSVMKCQRIYLDLNFWIYLRDASLGNCEKKHSVDLLLELQARADSGDLVCPIEESVFIELFKQKDPLKRQATAGVISRLSRGVSLVPQQERVRLEIEGLMQSRQGASGQSVVSVPWKVWTKTSYTMGEMYPVFHGMTPSENLANQKAAFDMLWELNFAEMIASFQDDGSFDSVCYMNDVAEKIREESKEHSHKIRSFRQVYLDEYIGLLSLFMESASEIMQEMYTAETGKAPDSKDPEKDKPDLLSMLGFCIKKSHGAATAMPTVHVGALCHAALRWDKMRKMRGNDLFDFRHAQAGVAYCNAFFTEKPLTQMLNQANMGIHRDFDCTVVGSIKDALGWIQSSDG